MDLTKRIKKLAKENKIRIIHSWGNEPQLLLFGENHMKIKCSDPKPFFDLFKPKYAFAEGISAGTTWTYKQSKLLIQTARELYEAHEEEENFVPSKADTPESDSVDESYDKIEECEEDMDYEIKGANLFQTRLLNFYSCHGCDADPVTIQRSNMVNSQGYLADFLLQHSKYPKMVFVGTDLPDLDSRMEEISKEMQGQIQKIHDRFVDSLDNPIKLSRRQQKHYESLRDDIAEILESYNTALEVWDKITKNLSEIPNWQEKIALCDLMKKSKAHLKKMNSCRENTMGETIVKTLGKERGIFIVGLDHLRLGTENFMMSDKSLIYQHLEKANIPYVAMNIFRGYRSAGD